MDKSDLNFWMTAIGIGCWAVCFWWMYRISDKQSRLLDKISDQGRRIERLSKVEHDLIKDVHPKVSDIKEGMAEVIAVVRESTESAASGKPKKG